MELGISSPSRTHIRCLGLMIFSTSRMVRGISATLTSSLVPIRSGWPSKPQPRHISVHVMVISSWSYLLDCATPQPRLEALFFRPYLDKFATFHSGNMLVFPAVCGSTSVASLLGIGAVAHAPAICAPCGASPDGICRPRCGHTSIGTDPTEVYSILAWPTLSHPLW